MALFKEAQMLVKVANGGYQIDPRKEANYHNGKLIGTNWGISASDLANYIGRTPTAMDMRNLSKHTAIEIRKINLWVKNNLDKLKNQSLANLLFEGALFEGSNGTRFLIEKALRSLKKPMSYYKVFTESGIDFLNSLDQRELFKTIKSLRLERSRKNRPSQQQARIKKRLRSIVFVSEQQPNFTKVEIEHMQAYLLELGSTKRNHKILDHIMSTGGVDGFMGKGFRAALNQAIDCGYLNNLDDLYQKIK